MCAAYIYIQITIYPEFLPVTGWYNCNYVSVMENNPKDKAVHINNVDRNTARLIQRITCLRIYLHLLIRMRTVEQMSFSSCCRGSVNWLASGRSRFHERMKRR